MLCAELYAKYHMRNLCFVLFKCLYLSWSDIYCVCHSFGSNKIKYKETVAFEWILNNEPVENNLTFSFLNVATNSTRTIGIILMQSEKGKKKIMNAFVHNVRQWHWTTARMVQIEKMDESNATKWRKNLDIYNVCIFVALVNRMLTMLFSWLLTGLGAGVRWMKSSNC